MSPSKMNIPTCGKPSTKVSMEVLLFSSHFLGNLQAAPLAESTPSRQATRDTRCGVSSNYHHVVSCLSSSTPAPSIRPAVLRSLFLCAFHLRPLIAGRARRATKAGFTSARSDSHPCLWVSSSPSCPEARPQRPYRLRAPRAQSSYVGGA